MLLTDSYWQYRRARLAVKRPEFALLDLLLFSGSRNPAEKVGYLDQCKGLYQMGQYHTDKGMEYLANLFRRFKKHPDSVIDKSLRLKDRDWDDLDRSEAAADDGVNRSEANFGDNKDSFERMGPQPGTDIARPRGPRVRFTPDNPENRVESEHVGPERQVRRNDDPWPLAAPAKDQQTDVKALPSAANDDDYSAGKGEDKGEAGGKKETDEKPADAKASKGKVSADKERDVKSGDDSKASADTGDKKKSPGKEASDRGAEKAREREKDRRRKRRSGDDQIEM